MSGNSNHPALEKTVKPFQFFHEQWMVSHTLLFLSRWKVTHILFPQELPQQVKTSYQIKVSVSYTYIRIYTFTLNYVLT